MNKPYFISCIIVFGAFIGTKTNVTAKKSLLSTGYSDDPEICNVYNKNLLLLWDLMEKNHLVEPPIPDKEDIHDLFLLIKSFLDHRKVANKNKSEKSRAHVKKKRIVLNKIMNDIKDIISTKKRTEWASAIVELITYNFRHFAEHLENISCHKKNDERLKKYTDRAIEKYLEGNCTRSLGKKGNTGCSEEAIDDFTDIMKSIIQRYIVGSYCRPDETKRTFPMYVD